jgi:RNA polymerase sigma-70 factor (ECF subfamily)
MRTGIYFARELFVIPFMRPALINGTAGAVTVTGGRVLSVMGFIVAHGRIAAIDVLYDPERLAGLDLSALDDVR